MAMLADNIETTACPSSNLYTWSRVLPSVTSNTEDGKERLIRKEPLNPWPPHIRQPCMTTILYSSGMFAANLGLVLHVS